MFPKYTKTILFFIIAVLVLSAGIYTLRTAEIFTGSAQSDDNLTGYAWSDNMGWISFNCTNEANCGSSNYGVDLDMEYGDFTGYAWSENIGWIDFAPDGPYPGVPKHGVKYEYEDTGFERRVTGWAKALVLGDEGWIKLHSDPWLSGWDQRRKITIDSSKIDSDLSHFPIPLFINTAAGQLNTDISSIFDEVGTSSQKIAITDSDATTQIYAEVEKWDATAEEAVVWVSSNNLNIDSASDTDLYLYYDNDHADNDSYVRTDTNATTSDQIWGDSYSMVQHFNESSGGAADSTSNNNDGSLSGGVTQGATGQADGAYSFDGSDDYVNVAGNSGFDQMDGGFTWSVWFKGDTQGESYPRMLDFGDTTLRADGTSGSFRAWFSTDGSRCGVVDANDSTLGNPDTSWHRATVIYDVANTYLYIDGSLNDQGSCTGTLDTGYDLTVAAQNGGSSFFAGDMDEVRISTTTRSSAWIKASYEAGIDDLLTWGQEEMVDYGVTADINTGDFSGWAWNKSQANNASGIGWISFYCGNSGAGGCADTNYRVTGHLNTVASTSDLTAPNWSQASACSGPVLRSILRWQFNDPDKGASQDAYHLVVDTDGTRDDDTPLLDTGKTSGDAKQYSLTSYDLDYNTSYYWWIKVWDNHNIASDWNQYDTEPDTDNDDGSTYTFTTYKHEFPEVDFYWVPDPISFDEDVTFTSDTLRYTTSEPTTATSCSTSTCDYAWDFSGSDVTIEEGTTASSSIVVHFTSSSTQVVALEVTDQDGYTCASSTSFELNPKLPSWREVKVEE